MSNNLLSPTDHLQQQELLLRMEYEFEKEEFKRQTETMGISRKVKRGLFGILPLPDEVTTITESISNRNYTYGRY